MYKITMKVADVQDLQYRMHCAVEVVRAVHTSMNEGSCAVGQDDYDALFGAYLLLHTLDEELKETAEDLWGAISESQKR